MEPGPRNRISDLYYRALECRPEERDAFLKGACDGDPALLREVESLLRYESDAAPFLETPAAVAGDFARTLETSQMIGRQLGPYTITAPLGAGGMGEVYRARDSKLGRDVAIKILPSHFTADPERRSRFAREARLLATLNHPHVGAIYGLEEIDGVTALVLELVEGPTLADRLARGPLPIADALAIARQLAEALGAAHEKAIVHRDLKPANIVLQGAALASGVPSSDQRARVLDFGLARTIAGGLDGDLTERPSGSFDGTAEGRILGTPAYMSPEQARGHAVDRRTDIWAFGCVLFEMLAGRRAFAGDTVSDTFVSILEREPEWTALPAATPASIRTLLERCLRKDPRKRLHDIADARIELEDANQPVGSTRSAVDIAPAGPARGRERLAWIAAGVLALALGGTMLVNRREVPPTGAELVEFPILPPEGWRFIMGDFAVSPDGRRIAFVAASKSGSSLWVRSFAAVDPRPIAGTDGARNPFWSPDSQSIGFFANNQLKTVPAGGESPVESSPWSMTFPLAAESGGQAPMGTWNSKGVIVFGPASDGNLYQVGVNENRTPSLVPTGGEGFKRRPLFLPDGQHFIYFTDRSGVEIRVASLTTADSAPIGTFESSGVYAGGHLFFMRGGNLMMQALSEETLKLEGEPVSLGVQVRRDNVVGSRFSVSTNGRLAFLPPPSTQAELTWLDRRGRPLGIVGEPGVYGNLDLSPDGRKLAVARLMPRPSIGNQTDIWVIDLATDTATRLTDDPGNEYDPAWSPDGKHIVFNSGAEGLSASLLTRASDGSGADVPLAKSGTASFVAAWSRADVIIFNARTKDKAADLMTLRWPGDSTPEVFVSTQHSELNGTFSPDGRWVAYQSDASGRYEVLVRPFPDKDPVRQISRAGGMYPRWRGDGEELFFVAPDGTMMAADFDPAVGGPKGVPRPLFATQISVGDNRPYVVDKTGERFLLPIRPEPRLTAVMDWRALGRR